MIYPDVQVFAGAAIIVSAGLYTMYREQIWGKQRRTKEVPPPGV